MSKVITFSSDFPKGHRIAGAPTEFSSKLLSAFAALGYDIPHPVFWKENWAPKWTTIRGGFSRRAGDYFSPRRWSGRPYNSKQIIIAPDIKIARVWEVQICFAKNNYSQRPMPFNYERTFFRDNGETKWREMSMSPKIMAANDGLDFEDFCSWFNPKGMDIVFSGQIITWNPSLEIT